MEGKATSTVCVHFDEAGCENGVCGVDNVIVGVIVCSVVRTDGQDAVLVKVYSAVGDDLCGCVNGCVCECCVCVHYAKLGFFVFRCV